MTIYRRHSKPCPQRKSGSDCTRCACPLWADLRSQGGKREPLNTRDFVTAVRRVVDMLDELNESATGGTALRATIPVAIEKFHAANPELAEETKRKYRRVLAFLSDFCCRQGILYPGEVTSDHMLAYRQARGTVRWTWLKELEIVRAFFRFCIGAKWIGVDQNPCAVLKARKPKLANSVTPYTREDYLQILEATGTFGRTKYERRRARAMIMLLRFTGMRISDVVTLSKDHIVLNRVQKEAVKNGKLIDVELPPVVLTALASVPAPRGAPTGHPLFFWNGHQSLRSVLRSASRTLTAVFRSSGVKRAHAHRFRHTLASELLANGYTAEDVGSVLGDDPRMIRTHYAKWMPERQRRNDLALRAIHETIVAQTEACAAAG